MTRQQAPARANLVLAVLFAGAFVMGCAEMLVVGMLDLIATDLAVSVSAAGALVTANALGLAIGGPLLTFLTTRFDRRHVLIARDRRVRPGQPAARRSPRDYPIFLLAGGSSSARCRGCSSRPRSSRRPRSCRRSAPAGRWRSSSPASPWRVRWACHWARCSVRRSAGAARSSRSSPSAPSCWWPRSLVLPSVPTSRESRAVGPGPVRVRARGCSRCSGWGSWCSRRSSRR